MRTSYVLFMQNLVTQEEFVASIEAESVGAAKQASRATYPGHAYQVLTCYAEKELQTVLDNLHRWPGVPSKVQPTPEEMSEHVRVKVGGLPPLRKATAGTVQAERHVETEELSVMMRLMAEQSAARLARLESLKTGSAPRAAAPAIQGSKPSLNSNAGKSVVELLRGLRS